MFERFWESERTRDRVRNGGKAEVKHSTTNPTVSQQKRFSVMQQIGCIICILDHGRHETPGDIHHILSGGKRIGHDATLYLTPWFHRGQPPNGWTIEKATEVLGPSMFHNPKEFKERYGTEAELLEFQNELIKHFMKREQDDEE